MYKGPNGGRQSLYLSTPNMASRGTSHLPGAVDWAGISFLVVLGLVCTESDRSPIVLTVPSGLEAMVGAESEHWLGLMTSPGSLIHCYICG